jgi:hypothetical protein
MSLDQNLVNQYLASVEHETGITEVNRQFVARYDLIFDAKTVLPQVRTEIKALQDLIKIRSDELFNRIDEQSKSDDRLASLTQIQKLAYVRHIVIPEISANANLIKEKYPGAIEFLMGQNMQQASQNFTSHPAGIDLGDAVMKPVKFKTSKMKF